MKNSWMLSSFMRLIMINGPIAVNIRPLIPRWSCRKCQEWKCQLSKRTWQVLKWGLERQQRREQEESWELAGWRYTFGSCNSSDLIAQFHLSQATPWLWLPSDVAYSELCSWHEAKDLALTKWVTGPLGRRSSTLSFRNLLPAEIPRNVALLCRMDTPVIPLKPSAGQAGWLATKGNTQTQLPFSGFHICIHIHIYIATIISCLQKSGGKQQKTLELFCFPPIVFNGFFVFERAFYREYSLLSEKVLQQ